MGKRAKLAKGVTEKLKYEACDLQRWQQDTSD